MIDGLDTDRIAVSGFDETDPRRSILALEDTAVIILEQAPDETFETLELLNLEDLEDTDRVRLPRARTQADWPPEPPPPQSRSRRHKAVYAAVGRPQTSSDS